ncbi:hypothetical protein TNCV_3251841 [Trichonephila clavipes]|nr:hypothetical protein TNCV_3251841 [Trichonephila clavipes]
MNCFSDARMLKSLVTNHEEGNAKGSRIVTPKRRGDIRSLRMLMRAIMSVTFPIAGEEERDPLVNKGRCGTFHPFSAFFTNIADDWGFAFIQSVTLLTRKK